MTVVFSLFPRLSAGNSSYYFLIHERFIANDTKLSEFEFKSLLGTHMKSRHHFSIVKVENLSLLYIFLRLHFSN